MCLPLLCPQAFDARARCMRAYTWMCDDALTVCVPLPTLARVLVLAPIYVLCAADLNASRLAAVAGVQTALRGCSPSDEYAAAVLAWVKRAPPLAASGAFHNRNVLHRLAPAVALVVRMH